MAGPGVAGGFHLRRGGKAGRALRMAHRMQDGGSAPTPPDTSRLPFEQQVDYKQREINPFLTPGQAGSPAARDVARMATPPQNPFEFAGQVGAGNVRAPSSNQSYPNQQGSSYGYGAGDVAREHEHANKMRDISESVLWNLPLAKLAKLLGAGEKMIRMLERGELARDPAHAPEEMKKGAEEKEHEKHEAVENMLKKSHEMYGHRKGGKVKGVAKKALRLAKSNRRVAA